MRISFDEALPVVQLKEEIGRAILENQVVVVSGETGSGKTTQLPKICLEVGRGAAGLIGHTQPRRVAARSIAGRIASELQSEIGLHVGYKVRFTDRTNEGISIKLMTDGILLAETRTDPLLARYGTLIIDEAHERSLNIDFLLGYLKTILPRRPDLKVIVTSATIDAERFAGHFDAAVISVPGRSYPVEVRYRPFEEEEDPDMEASILAAVEEAERHPGDILVFLPGEREIRNAAEALRKHARMEILPLYSRLSVSEQEKVFRRSGTRRIVLATNVAETSLTVPNIGSVIDTGLARINRYSYRNKVEQLRIEPVSKASANQRAGRSGRVMNGLCIRLYSESDFTSRPEYTDPEILRSSLASVILKMKSMGLGEVESFPFIDPPSPKMISDGYQLLMELGAVDDKRVLTDVGSRLSKLPCDPRIGRMILASKSALSEVLIIASVLGIQDPRESPSEKREAAQAAHQAFSDEKSDFMGLLKLWGHFDEMKKTLSNRKLAAECRRQFLSLSRLKEWRDLHGQLSVQIAEMGMRVNEKPASYEEIHRALLSGLLGNIGFKTEEGYLGARGIRFQIFPGSKVRKKPKWLMASEITETSRLYARSIAEIDPAWVEKAGEHLLKRHYFDPHWEKKSAQVAAFEQVTLYGLIVVPKRRVNFGAIDPEASREIFIMGALVQGEYDTKAAFFGHNERLVREVEALEHKARRSDYLVDEQVLYEFYSERIPEGIVGGISFEKWRREAEGRNPELLFLKKEDLLRRSAEDVTLNRYPDSMEADGATLPLSYRFEPGHVMDGVTVTIPLHLLNQMNHSSFDRLVPGLLREKLTHIIKSLPKALRKNLIPVSGHVDKCMDEKGPLLAAMRKALKIDIASLPELPPHLMMNYRIVDGSGEEIGMGRDLEALKARLGEAAERDFGETVSFETREITEWDFDLLPECVESGGVTSHPALVDEGTHVALVALDTIEKATAQSKRGVNRLFRLALQAQFRQLEKAIPESFCLRASFLCSPAELKDSISRLAASSFLGLPRSKSAFEEAVLEAKPLLHGKYSEILKLADEIIELSRKIGSRLEAGSGPAYLDMKEQLSHLVHPGFLDSADLARLVHYPRYLKAMLARLDKLPNPRDALLQAEISQRWLRYLKNPRPEFDEYRWMIEELRVSLFAQELRTPFPVSGKRLDKLWESFR